MPRLATIKNRNVVQPIPLHIKFVGKFRFVLSGFLLNVEFESGDDLFRRRVISRQRIDQVLDPIFCRRTHNDVGLPSNVAISLRPNAR